MNHLIFITACLSKVTFKGHPLSLSPCNSSVQRKHSNQMMHSAGGLTMEK